MKVPPCQERGGVERLWMPLERNDEDQTKYALSGGKPLKAMEL